ncbi:MAG: four helix bundle protein [Parcubacteria group bacterium]|nr:four helix bundle protein [Parcubacteria group bacterium]
MSYKELKSYQQATIIYDYTVEFCNLYVNKSYKSNESNRSYRTTDQMVQAGRSGKQNIVEGSTERTSQKSELKLLGVARASLQELLEDFEDFLRQRGLPQWGKEHAKAREVRALAYKTNRSHWTYKSYLEDPETAANAAICLIHQANYLLDKQIAALEEKFVKEGGYTEKLFKKRLGYRAQTRNYADEDSLSPG